MGRSLSIILSQVLFVSSALAAPNTAVHFTGKQGQIIRVKIPSDGSITSIEGNFRKRNVHFTLDSQSAQFIGLLGVDMSDTPGIYPLKVNIEDGEKKRTASYRISVKKENFRVQNFTVPEGTGNPSPQTTKLLTRQKTQVHNIFAIESPEKLWTSEFVVPVEGPKSGSFGSSRVINGAPRAPHNGEDISAKIGADVVATNDGRVQLTVEHVFSGKSIFLDHGLGLFSMYFHLSEILVTDGEFVRAGQIIGRVGMTGRTTGPHLHWGVKLNGAYVNPFSLLELN